ncbi:glycosyltransferase family 2 protein [Blastococcus brunescens]|uniref:Glycosyltransferase family 2 protein n=1 Tax=Blastococcus brunescens TaxID=1564165 RepID=A0ABZ1AZ40_9ACTN|nr:glycosyltransferase family 2 protein [Blastococcus sp. BMG 8361]WRL62913.1 glycosyltransferase family 2 protein [Blastococcus sp. BMG 8361]
MTTMRPDSTATGNDDVRVAARSGTTSDPGNFVVDPTGPTQAHGNFVVDPAAVGATPSRAIDTCELSIVLPCLNEAETLAVCIRKAQASLRSLGVDGEVIVADNGSTDGSQDIARAEGARVVDVPRKGYGAALRGGIEAAGGRYVLMGDADDSYALDDIGGFLEKLRGGADLVMGNRFQGGIAPGAMPFLHRYLGNPVLSRAGRLFFHIPVGDFHCGMRAFRRDRVLALGMQTEGMEFASEMVVRASLRGLRIEEVPTRLQPDGRSRAPHLRTWRDGWRHLRFLFAFSPRWFLLYPGLAMIAGGLLGLVLLAVDSVTIGGLTFGVHTMLACATAVVAGLQVTGVAVISRSYAAHLGMLPRSARLEKWLERTTLERGLVLGALLALAGVLCFVLAVIQWGSTGFGMLDPVSTMPLPILGMVLIVGGAQLGVVSFAISLSAAAGSRPGTDAAEPAPRARRVSRAGTRPQRSPRPARRPGGRGWAAGSGPARRRTRLRR